MRCLKYLMLGAGLVTAAPGCKMQHDAATLKETISNSSTISSSVGRGWQIVPSSISSDVCVLEGAPGATAPASASAASVGASLGL